MKSFDTNRNVLHLERGLDYTMTKFHSVPSHIGCWILLCIVSVGCGPRKEFEKSKQGRSGSDQPVYTGSKLVVFPPYPGRDEEGEVQFWEVTARGLAELSELDGVPTYVSMPAPETLEYDRCEISVRDPINSVVYMDAVTALPLEQRPVFQFKAHGSAIVPPATRVAVVVHFWSDSQPKKPHWIEGNVIVVAPIAKNPQSNADVPDQRQ